MLTQSEGFFFGYDQTKLYMRLWTHPEAEATLFITHGQAEHSDCYQRFVHGLNQHRPLNYIAWDLHGHGKSEGRRGHIDQFEHYINDYELFLEAGKKVLSSEAKKLPFVLLGHSMGGLIQTLYLNQNTKNAAAGQVLSSPLLGLNLPVPWWKEKAANLLSSTLPQLTLNNEISFDQLTSDKSIQDEYVKDVYRHDKIASQVFLGFKKYFDQTEQLAKKIKLPTYLCISDHDPIVSTEKALLFFDTLHSKNKHLKIMEDGKHELFNDVSREIIYKSINDYLGKIL